MSKRLLLTLLSSLWMLGLPAQMGRLFDASHQVSSNFTNQLYLDNEGFIWSATRNGLNKYDGYQFRILKKERDRQSGMASNYVNCIVQDRQGLFYVGMWGHLQTYDGNLFRTVEVKDLRGNRIDCYVTCFVRRRNGEVWVGTSGFGVLRIDDAGHAHQVGGALKGIDTVQQLMEDQKGNLWVVTREQGLLCYNGRNAHTYFGEAPMNTYMRKVCEGKNGIIYLGTSKAGLYQLGNNGFFRIEEVGTKPIADLYFNRKGELVIGYDGEGLGIYQPSTRILVDNPYYNMDVDLSKSKVTSIIEDARGNLWLGLLQKGIFMQPAASAGFNYMGYKLGSRNKLGSACILSTLVDSRGQLWVGTDKDGLYRFDADHQLIRHYKEDFPATVMTMAEDRWGHIWVGSYNEGGGWITPASGQYHKFDFGVSGLSIFDIEIDHRDRLWAGTMGYGLLSLDLPTGKLTTYRTDHRAESQRGINSLTNDYISQLSLSPDHRRLYVSTTMGLCCLDLTKNSWTSFFGGNCLNYRTPIRIAREFGGTLWIGTNDGLHTYSLSARRLKRLAIAKGLGENGISSIEQDKRGRLWVATDQGLYCYDPRTRLTQSYFIDNGLQSNEFSDGASSATPAGILYFGGVGGLSWFDPSAIEQDRWEATVRLTDFIINGEPVNSLTESGRFRVTDTTTIASTHFELGYQDNSFSIRLSTLTYDTPEHITYLYSINGEDFVRLQPGANEINFSSLSPGTYRFRVKAERNNVETPERAFTVIVHAPWYRSAWAFCFYLLALSGGVWYYLANLRRKEQDRLRLQEHIHAEELGEAKLRFFINISHEIRTPLTLIITPLLSLIKQEDDTARRSVYETMKRNADRILHLINQIMDLRKIDKGLMAMKMAETDLVEFVGDIHSLFEHQAKTKGIELKYEHDADALPVWLDRQNFDKIVVNILSNAFKFTPAGGRIVIGITHDDREVRIAVSDNGEKIPADKLDKIFERFYQSASTVNDRNVGTGIGLDLTRSLVELHHGTIEAHNLDVGCEFVVTMPLGNAHLKPEEMVQERESMAVEDTLADHEEELMAMDEPEERPQNGGRPILVIAEDDDEIRDYLASEFSRDYEVHVCVNGLEALKCALRVRPDLVLSDVMMPEMDGNTLCTKLKSNPATNDIPVVLLTARNRDEDRLEGLETGADAYVVKPFNMDILRHTILNLIKGHQLLRVKYGRTEKVDDKLDEVRLKSPDERLLERVMASINGRLDDSDLCVDMIADDVGLSRVHLHRKMKELTGQTPHDFIRNMRLKRAAYLLATQGQNVTEVMYACGFSNSASFSTTFKKFYGVAPRDYMREHGNR